jgi:sRNA-binding regulator protein Hfq
MRNRLLLSLPGADKEHSLELKKSERAVTRSAGAPQFVKPFAASPPPTTIENGNSLGPRKLVRPKLPPRPLGSRYAGPRPEQPVLAHHASLTSAAALTQESSHAEAFYFQKQVQMQTPLVFVLEDGDQVEGVIEWYDRNVIKVKNSGRVLIYKSSIKYLYKVGENHP